MSFFTRSNRRDRLSESDFNPIFLEYWDRIYRVAYRLTGDPTEAEDLALETFTRLWQQPPAAAENLGGWLYRVVCNLGYNALRASRRREQYESQTGSGARDDGHEATPERESETRMERRKVRRVLRQMNERQAQILILRHAGLSYREIAAALELNPASIGNLLVRAEQQFEKLYEGEES